MSLQAVLCVLVLTTLWIALRRARWSAPLVLIAVSPVCLLFWFNDPIGTLRKELLFYAAMSLILLVITVLAWANRKKESVPTGVWAIIGGLTIVNIVIAVFV